MSLGQTLDARIAKSLPDLSPAERKVANYIIAEKADALLGSAAQIAAIVGTSDATVVRTVQSLGFKGIADLKEALINDMSSASTTRNRLQKTLDATGDDLAKAIDLAFEIQIEALADMQKRNLQPSVVQAVRLIAATKTVGIFGLGPSSALAEYLSLQIERLGCSAATLNQSGIALADSLLSLNEHSVLFMMAYGRAYREAEVAITHAKRVGARIILVTDSLFDLRDKADIVLPIRRGRAGQLATHGEVMAVLEAVIMGVASCKGQHAVDNLEKLDLLRAELSGRGSNSQPPKR